MRITEVAAARRAAQAMATTLPTSVTWEVGRHSGPLEERVGAAIIAAGEAFEDPDWREWAVRWLAGADRTAAAAHAAFAIADAEVEASGSVPPPPAFPEPAVAARAASHLAIELARILSLREMGEHALARALEQTTMALARRLSAAVPPSIGVILEQRPRIRMELVDG